MREALPRIKLAIAGLGVLSALIATPAPAEDYPAKPVKIVVATAAGSAPDVLARIVAERLTQVWGQQVLVLNRPGGGGSISAQAVAASEPDGYTLLFGMSSMFAVLPETNDKLPFDLQRDLVSVGLVGDFPFVIAASPTLGVSTLGAAIALAKSKPEGLLYAAGNRGSLPNVAGELLAREAGIKLDFVPYTGTPAALNDVISGRVALVIEVAAGISGALASGSLNALAVTSPKRLPDFPNLATMAETIPGFEATGWFALLTKSGVPEDVIRKVNRDLAGILAQEELRRKFETLGTYARPMPLAETASFIHEYESAWRPLVRAVVKDTQNKQ